MSIIKANTFQDRGGNTILSSDGSGNITLPSAFPAGQNTPMFYAYLSSEISTLTHDAWTKLTYNSKLYDEDSTFSTSTHRFTPGVTGKYLLTAQAKINNPNSTPRRIGIKIQKNGSDIGIQFHYMPDGNNLFFDWSVNVVTVDNCTSTSDYYEVYVFQNNAAGNNNGYVTATRQWTHFTGQKLIGA